MNLINLFDKTIEYSFYLLFFLVPLILTPFNYELFEYNKMMLTYGLTVIIIGAWLGKMIAKKEVRIQKTPLDLPIVLYLISSILSTIFSIHLHTSIWGYYSRFHGGLMSTISYILLYYAFVTNMTKRQKAKGKRQKDNLKFKILQSTINNQRLTINCIYIILFSAFLVASYGILEHFGIDAQYWVQDVKNRVFSTLGQPNWLSAFIDALICIPIAFVLMKSSKKQSNKTLFIIHYSLFIILYLCLLFTGSRSGIFGFLAAFLAFLSFLQFSEEKRLIKKIISLFLPTILFALIFLQEWKGKEIKLIFPSLLIFGVIYLINIEYLLWVEISAKDLAKKINAFILIFVTSSLLIGTPISPSLTKLINKFVSHKLEINSKTNKPSTPSITKKAKPKYAEAIISESADIRKVVWKGAIDIWRHWPIFGSGLETFAYSYYNFRPRAHNDLSEWDFLYNKAHNEFLNILACQGIVGFMTYMFLVGVFLYWGLNYLKCEVRSAKCEVEVRKKDDWSKNSKIQKFKNSISKMSHFPLLISLIAGYTSILVTNFFGFSVVIIGLFFFLFPAFCFILADSLDPENSYSLILGSTITLSNIKASWQSYKDKRLTKKQRKKLKRKGCKLTTCQYALLILLLFTFYFLLFTLIKMWRADYFFSQSNKYKDYNLVESFQYIQKAIQLNPHEALYHDQLAKIAAKTAVAYQQVDASESAQLVKQLEDLAVQEIQKTFSMNNVHLNFYKNQAQTYLYLSFIDPDYKLKAVDTLLAAIKLAPTDAKLYFNLGKLYGNLPDLANSISYLEKAVKLKPNYRVAHIELAEAYEKAGLIDKAIAEYQFNLEMINPQDDLSQSQIERLKKKQL